MMVLLEEKSLTPRTKFQPEKLSLTLTERTSTATMTVSEDAPEMTVGDWMKMEDGPGAGIVWRIKSIDDQYDRATKTVNLEHIINTLRDRIIIDEVKSEYISGSAGVWPTNGDTARFILENWQSTWRLGGVADGEVRNPYSFNGDDLFSALETVSGTIEDCFWHYDMSSYPFRIDLVYLSPSVVSEMRTDRNIRTLKKTIDRTGMYTRIFPIGKDDLRIPGGSISMNTEIYGAIHKTETDESKETADELYWWAYEKLRKHCYPTVTISISGLDLAEATGETLDKLRVGYMCRVPLPEYNTTITERVTKLSYSDVINDPMNVTVTLSNKQEDVATISSVINNLTSAMGGGGRTSAANSGKDHAWIEDTEEHVALVAEGIIGTDENGEPNWKRLSQIVVDGEGLHQTVEEIKEGDVIRDARIDVNEKRILQEVTDRTNADGELQGRITVQADRITQEVTQRKGDTEALSGRITVQANRITQEVNDRTSADNTLSGRITVEANRITQEVTRATNAEGTLGGRITVEAGRINQIVSAVGKDGEVTAASITLAINEGKSGAWIDADNVWIGNSKSTTVIAGKLEASDITADFLSAKIATIPTLRGIAASFSGNVSTTSGVIAYQVYADGNNISNPVIETRVQGPTSNVYTLQHKTADGTWHDAGTFSRATSLSGAWSGGTFTVTASPQGNTASTTITLDGGTGGVASPDYTANSFISHKAYVNVKGSQTSGTATVKKILVDATNEYNAGFDASHSACIGGNGGSASNPDKRTTATINPGGSIDLWPYLKKSDDTWTWGDKCTVSANGSFYGNTTLYYYNLGDHQYYSAGSHNWYYT